MWETVCVHKSRKLCLPIFLGRTFFLNCCQQSSFYYIISGTDYITVCKHANSDNLSFTVCVLSALGLILPSDKLEIEKSCLGCRDKVIFCGWAEVAVERGKTEPGASQFWSKLPAEIIGLTKGQWGGRGFVWESLAQLLGGLYVQVSQALTDIRRAQWKFNLAVSENSLSAGKEGRERDSEGWRESVWEKRDRRCKGFSA